MKRVIFSLGGILLSTTAGAADDDSCNYGLEVIQLQDGSSSFEDDLQNMKNVAPELFSELSKAYPGMKYGLASFVDKPLPERGYGPYGGYPSSGFQYDYCYQPVLPMTSDAQAFQKAIDKLQVGSGFDFQENQFEGMLRCALDTSGTGFSSPTVTYDANGNPIVRVMIMITDATPHAVGDAEGATTYFWDYPRTWSPYPDSTTGGFGSDTFADYPQIIWGGLMDSYKELVSLFHKIDDNKSLSSTEQQRYDELVAQVGPYPWPDKIVPHPGDDSMPCEKVEYPSVEQMANALSARNIFPVILLASLKGDPSIGKECASKGYASSTEEERQECMHHIYDDYMKETHIPYYIGDLTGGFDNIVDAIKTAVGNITMSVCAGSTLPPATMPTTTPHTTMTTTTRPTTPRTTTPLNTATTTTTTKGTGGSSGGGVPIGPIAGAAAGAAVLAAGGYLAYRKFGAGALGKKQAPDAEAATQAEVPEAPVEREALEEVTMEMFQ